MQADRIHGGCAPSPGSEDLRAQRIVLTHVLGLLPHHLTIPELVQEITGSEGFAAEDAVERAVRDLDGIGLMNCAHGLAVPSRAAVHFDRLMLP